MATTQCAHCGAPIVDPTTSVNHGGATYCCANCSNAVEQSGSGSDPGAGTYASELRCRHCGTPITDESTLRARGDDPFCCDNCYRMAA